MLFIDHDDNGVDNDDEVDDGEDVDVIASDVIANDEIDGRT